MRELFEKKVNLILIVVILIVAILIVIPLVSHGCYTSTSNGEIETQPTTVKAATPDEETTETTTSDVKIEDTKVKIKKKNAKSSDTASISEKTDPRSSTVSKSTTSSKTSSKKEPDPKVFATAPKAENPADHNAQWNAGFLVAIDSPDTSYYCGHVELSDKDRVLLEKLCMGELGSGGFTGAALIAQAVKNAMYFDGYTNVQDVINNLHYTGRLTTPTQSVKNAVVYIFDMDKDAIQHRILYMYNPKLMDAGYNKFHETQRYICTFHDVRFFDR